MEYRLDFRGAVPEPASDNRVSLLSVPGKYSKTLTSDGDSSETATKSISLGTTEGNNSVALSDSGISISSDVKIKLQVGTTLVELTATKLKLVSDLLSENGV